MKGAARLLLPIVLYAAAVPGLLGGEALSFQQALQQADARGEILELRRVAIRRAELSLAEARTRLGPELSFQASGAYLASPPEGVTVRAGELGTIPPPISYAIPEQDLTFIEDARNSYFEFSLQLSQPVFTWGRLGAAVQLAEEGLDVSRVELDQERRRMYLDLHTAYYTGVLARESAAVLGEILDILEQIEEDRMKAFELGAANESSVLEIRAQIAGMHSRIVRAREAHVSAREAVALFTRSHAGQTELSTAFREELPDLDEAMLKSRAAERSPSLQKARLEQQQARANLKRIRGAALLRPEVALNLSFEVSGQALPWSEEDWEETWDLDLIVGVGTRGTLFDSGRSPKQTKGAEQAVNAAGLAVDLMIRQIHLQMRRAVETLRGSEAELHEARAALAQAEEERKNAGRAFEQQLLSREQWGAARIELLRKRLMLLEKQYAFERALYELETLAGSL